ncbi:uncharacterized protein LOC114281443 [Camellia sinensis]|uniref:uncharacterized protein LOC114281443 n=1 Tax=Camellia sinensis TaxID=4442 RepID=UPI0010365F64|nr:uncharacterized protein LOC114281443 [Camellia sinensis]
MRRFTQLKEFVKPSKTRFATAFLTLQRVYQQRNNLRKMFTSEQWTKSKWAKEPPGKKTAQILLTPSFWNHCHFALQFSCPLVHVLRKVDGEEKPPMGYIYEAMDRAKEAIANSFNGNEEKYKDVFQIIDQRWNVQLHRPLHAAWFYLNLEFLYKDPRAAKDKEIVSGLYQCISRLIPTLEAQDKVTTDLKKYENAEGIFGIPMAIRQRTTRVPANWWSSYGHDAPELQQFAIKFLSLVVYLVVSGIGLYSKIRNRLAQKRLNDLVSTAGVEERSQRTRSTTTRTTPIGSSSPQLVDEEEEWEDVDSDEEGEEDVEGYKSNDDEGDDGDDAYY